MARIHGMNANFSFDSVAIEDELNQIDLNMDIDTPEVTAFADTDKAFVAGKKNWGFDVRGAADFVAAQGDATIFASIGAGEQAMIFAPTGATANTDDPNYTGNVVTKRYQITCGVADAVRYTAQLQGSGALTRDVTP